MATRDNNTRRKNAGTTATDTSGATSGTAAEQRVLAFAEQLGRIAGTFQARAAGWMDRETLNKQIASVRDDAAALLEQLAQGATKATQAFEAATKAAHASKPAKKTTATAPRPAAKGRSGGVVDAPGKKHRKRAPSDPDAKIADSQATKVRTAKPMAKTSRLRGRG